MMYILYLIEVSGRERGTLAGDDDDCVAPDDRRGTKRDKCEERVLVRAGYSDDTHRLVNTHRASVECGFLGGGGSGRKDTQTEDLSHQLPPPSPVLFLHTCQHMLPSRTASEWPGPPHACSHQTHDLQRNTTEREGER